MSDYVFLYRGRDTSASAEQMQKTTQKWIAWMKELNEKGHLKDRGNPLESNGNVIRGRDKTISDGPYAEAKDIIAGYTLIEAQDPTQAAALAKGCPILEGGGSVEVRPVRPMNM